MCADGSRILRLLHMGFFRNHVKQRFALIKAVFAAFDQQVDFYLPRIESNWGPSGYVCCASRWHNRLGKNQLCGCIQYNIVTKWALNLTCQCRPKASSCRVGSHKTKLGRLTSRTITPSFLLQTQQVERLGHSA